MRVLLVEDDALIGGAIREALSDASMSVDWVQDGQAALAAASDDVHALVLLDIGLPKQDGLSVLKALRHKRASIPVIIITARDALEDRIAGLDLGADDYLVKPFPVDELMARMRAVLRRHHGCATPILGNDIIELDPVSRIASRNGIEHSLSAREYAVLHALILRPGQILSRSELEDRVYGWNEEVASNAIEFLIHAIRKKLGQDAIKNVRGLGWMVPKS
uniref:response regulator transcription factor n=1 Tax=Marinobacterium profundum TaxID=1714300 RepID=UPI0008323ADA|nr:response regulator transcription factor [Marinobacterium profundum]